MLYRTFNYAGSESLSARKNTQSNQSARPNSPIVPSDGLDAAFLAACDKAEENRAFTGDKTIESTADRAFLDEDLDSDTDQLDLEDSDVEESNDNPSYRIFRS